MRKILSLFLITSLTIFASIGQVVLNEGFSAGSLPAGWGTYSASSDLWTYGEGLNFGVTSVIPDASGNIGEYASLDFSDDPDTTSLITPVVSVSGLSNPRLVFSYNSQTTSTAFTPYNRFIVDYWNGASWINITVIDTLTPAGWTEYAIAIDTSYKFGGDSVQFRFSGHEGGANVGGTGTSTFSQDMGLDNIIIENTPSCFKPTTLTASNVTGSSATISWVEINSATSWQVEWDLAGFTPGTGNSSLTASNPFSLTSLNSQTNYQFYVKSICGPGDTSSWTGPLSFTTPCATFVAPFLETFNTFTPACWDEATNGDLVTGPTGLGSGSWGAFSGAVRVNLYTTSFSDWIVSPTIDLSAGGLELAIDARVYAFSGGGASAMGSDDTVHVAISTDGGATWTSIYTWDTGNSPTTTSNSYVVDLSSYTGTNNVIGIYAEDGTVNDPEDYYFEIDNFEVRTPPTCPAPNTLSETVLSDSSSLVSWVESGTATAWEIEWGPSGFAQGTGTTALSASNPYTITGLTANTTYSWYVRAICGPADSSTWVGPSSFTTPCTVFTAPYTMDFEASTTSTPGCWSQTGSESWLFRNSGTGHIGSVGVINGSTASNGYFAWVDDSSPHNTSTTIESPFIDVSGLTIPQLSFYTLSDNEGDANGNVDFHVDVYDGANWNDSIYFSDANSVANAWEKIIVDLSSLTISGPIQVRFVVDELNGGGFDDDRAIDDVVIEDACLNVTAPFRESFTTNTGSTAPNCWTQSATTGGPWQFNVGALPDFGNNVAMPDRTNGTAGAYGWVDMSGTDAGVLLTTPVIDVSALTVPELSFWLVSHNNTASVTTFNTIYVEAFDGTSFVTVDSISGDFGLKWEYFSYDLSADTFNTNFVQIQFRAESGGDSFDYDNDMLLDEVQVKEFTTCAFPDQLVTSGVVADSAIFAWTENGTATQWQISYGPAGTMAGAGTTAITTSNPDTLTGLAGATTYVWYVRSICGAADTSAWSAGASFTTPCPAFLTAPLTESFDGTSTPTCWSQSAVLDGPWVFGNPGIGWNTQGCTFVPSDNTGNGGNMASLDFSGTGVTDVVLEMPAVDVSALTVPQLEFFFTMCGSGYTPINLLYVDAWDGTTWNSIDSIQEETNGWKKYDFRLTSYIYGTNLVKIRFRASSGANTVTMFLGDQGIDDVSIVEAPANDIAVTDIITPTTGCGLSATEVVQVEITNIGTAAQTGFPVVYVLDGVASTPETFTGSIAAGSTATFSFAATADLTTVKAYTIASYTQLAGDADTSNDSSEVVITSSANITSFPYTESFETGNGDWIVTGNASWALGVPAATIIDTASDGTQAWVTNLTGNYGFNELGFVNSPCLDFTTVADPYIELDIFYDIETSWDGATMQSSIDGGASWQLVGALNDPNNWYNDGTIDALTATEPSEDGWSGNGAAGSGTWVTAGNRLTGLGGLSGVTLRIVFATDGNTEFEGMAFDNVRISNVPKAPISLPITWDDGINVDYTTIDFGGNASMMTVDPMNTSNMVLQSVKTVGAQTWAGTTFGDSLATAIPFTTGNTTIRAVVYSPTAGLEVRLKVEDKTNPGISVETFVLTSVASGWDTLNFDLSAQAGGTAAINFANTYDKMSIFYNFGVMPTVADTFYVDYVEFANAPAVPDPYYPISIINTEDTAGVADSLNVFCWTSGTVIGVDLDGNAGLSFYITDMSTGIQEGMNVFNFNDVSNYVVTEGDSIMIHGEIIQFRGLTELNVDSIIVISSGNAIPAAIVSNVLDESTESRWINMTDKFILLDASGSTSYNMDATNGTDTITIRVDSDTDINDSLNVSTNALVVGDTLCGLLGIGSQFDFNAPFLEGYQIFPMRYSDITVCRNTIGIEKIDANANSVSIYPNPTNGLVTIESTGYNNNRVEIEVVDLNGRTIASVQVLNGTSASRETLDLSSVAKGIYFISIIDGNSRSVEKLIIK